MVIKISDIHGKRFEHAFRTFIKCTGLEVIPREKLKGNFESDVFVYRKPRKYSLYIKPSLLDKDKISIECKTGDDGINISKRILKKDKISNINKTKGKYRNYIKSCVEISNAYGNVSFIFVTDSSISKENYLSLTIPLKDLTEGYNGDSDITIFDSGRSAMYINKYSKNLSLEHTYNFKRKDISEELLPVFGKEEIHNFITKNIKLIPTIFDKDITILRGIKRKRSETIITKEKNSIAHPFWSNDP